MRRESGNLPADTTSFVGRHAEISRARQLLARTRLLTLTGPGGMGKSRLALRLAAQVRRSFPDGVWLADLAVVEKEELLEHAVLAAFEPNHDMGRPPMAALTGHLRDKRVLLVLDNCEHLLHPCAVLADALLAAVPDLHILATSRQALGVTGECLLTVPPLSAPDPDDPRPAGQSGQSAQSERDTHAGRSDALDLFTDRAAAALGECAPSEHGRTAALICRRLDGIPLAIELAAARLRVLTCEQILARLGDRFELLAGGSRAALPRQQTMRAALDWSFDLCAPGEQLLWARLSVFPGAFDLEAIESVCTGSGLTAQEVFGVVAGLVDKSVLVREEQHARYRMLETLRQYGHLRLGDGEDRALRRRHRDYYRALVLRAETQWFTGEQTAWFARLHQERPNLRTALDYCLTEPGEAQVGLEIAGSLWCHRLGAGSLEEERHWLGRALASDATPSPARLKALWADGWLALLRGDTSSGHVRMADCRALAQSLDDPLAQAYAEQFDGLTALFQDDFARAIPLFDRALALFRTHGDIGDTWATLYLLSLACCLSADPRAVALGEECLALCDAHGAQWSRSFTLWLLGLQNWLNGDTRQTVRNLQESLSTGRPAHNGLAVAQCLEVLAWVRASDGDGAQAAELLGAAQSAWEKAGTMLPGVGRLLHHRTECEALLRDVLSEECFTAHVQSGAALTMEQAIARALNKPPAQPSPPEHDPVTVLTPRERQVALLVTQGLTDKQIAAQLVISPRTAQGHVQRILAKLGFTTRTQIATWAQEHTPRL
ncbi:LuxR family transcriptional regulator [Streptomyces lunaelactis]|uniref:ATP-binding protein n=1 Tax=Streptomyces lunaelactis TaxID=1535768 RepID=UPI001584FB4D|nr:LuxR C-terminal-related transcriptional regulator [Streptomyces lunaelactis]NUK39653.1 LuxR family transcriptional regulator [Streptomyces lunaelactis]